MKQTNTIHIKVAKPCQEDWNNFHQTNNGGFCQSCQKEVIDFSQISSEEIVAVLQNNPNSCGRFRSDQLGTLPLPQTKFALLRPFKAAASWLIASALFMANLPQSQATKIKNYRIAQHDTVAVNAKKAQAVEGIQISGKVVDKQTGELLPGVNIYLKGTEIGVNTDGEGFFQFPQPLQPGAILVFDYIGMRRQEYTVPLIRKEKLTIEMELDYHVIMGEVSVAFDAKKKNYKPSLMQKIASWF